MNNIQNNFEKVNKKVSTCSIPLSKVDTRLIISSLKNEISLVEKYFDVLNLKYSDFFYLQSQLARLEFSSLEDLQIEFHLIDAQIAEWNRKLEDWTYVRWHLQELLTKIRNHLKEVGRHEA